MQQQRFAKDGPLYQQVSAWVEDHRQQLVEDIVRLVNIRSVAQPQGELPYGQGCRDALEEMLAMGRRYGMTAHNYDGRCGGLWWEEKQSTVGLWGHLDVVPEGDNWQNSPYQAVEKQGYLIGRGVQDNKGPAVACLYVMRCLRDLGLPLRHGVKLMVGCDEERGMTDVDYFRANYPCPQLNLVADCNFPVCYGEKGIIEAELVARAPLSAAVKDFTGGVAGNMVPDSAALTLQNSQALWGQLQEQTQGKPEFALTQQGGEIRLRAFGISKHTASPEGGRNAILLLSQAAAGLAALPEEDRALLRFLNQVNGDFAGTGLSIACADQESGALTCVGSMLHLEQGRLALHVNIRYPVTVDSAGLLRSMERACNENGYALRLIRDSAPNYYPKENPVVGALTQVYNSLTGAQSAPYVMGGGTYARRLPNAVAYGMGGLPEQRPQGLFAPGHGGGHEPDEGLCIANLLEAIKIYVISILAIDELDY